MSFNMNLFLKTLRRNGLSRDQIESAKEAYNVATLTAVPFPDLKVGDIFRSTQGVRLLAKQKDGEYILVSLSSFHDHVKNTGAVIAYPMSKTKLIDYMFDHKYEKIGRIEEMVGKVAPLVLDFEDEEMFLTPPPKRSWRPGLRR